MCRKSSMLFCVHFFVAIIKISSRERKKVKHMSHLKFFFCFQCAQNDLIKKNAEHWLILRDKEERTVNWNDDEHELKVSCEKMIIFISFYLYLVCRRHLTSIVYIQKETERKREFNRKLFMWEYQITININRTKIDVCSLSLSVFVPRQYQQINVFYTHTHIYIYREWVEGGWRNEQYYD